MQAISEKKICLIKNEEMQGLKYFDNKTHYSFMNNINVGAAVFGGNSHYLLRFIYLYYKTLKLIQVNGIIFNYIYLIIL